MLKPQTSRTFSTLLPPLPTEERQALRQKMKVDRVDPIKVDEHGVILDGHHRYAIDHDIDYTVVPSLTTAEKKAFALTANLVRRNLSPDQKSEIGQIVKAVANELRAEDPRKNTQKRVAAVLGVDRSTVGKWWDIPNGKHPKRYKPRPDARVKLSAEAKKVIKKRAVKGERQEQIAADYGVTQKTVSRVATQKPPKAKEQNVLPDGVLQVFRYIYRAIGIIEEGGGMGRVSKRWSAAGKKTARERVNIILKSLREWQTELKD